MGVWYSDVELEELLESYPVIKAQAAVEAEELKHLFPNCTAGCDGQPRGGELPDGTGAYAVRREERSRNTRRAKAVEIACEALTAQERELVRLMYFERWGRHHIKLHLGVRRSRLFYIRRSALDKLAEILL
ncbi:hypothetical protein [Anaeroselena agilis]|uniref:Transcriptional regulator n=1 Tax=Anaeroselena agilis TaxID=3063788 RepID=A0ABU3NVG0_9FIRM|nr:hypothetical protein [Selenomonadales bacterium 4137-cl]